MDPRVDHEASGSPELEREAAEIGIRIPIEPDLFRGQLAVETPPFRVNREGMRKFPKLRNSVQLLRNGDLHVMAGNAFIMGKRFQFVQLDCPACCADSRKTCRAAFHPAPVADKKLLPADFSRKLSTAFTTMSAFGFVTKSSSSRFFIVSMMSAAMARYFVHPCSLPGRRKC